MTCAVITIVHGRARHLREQQRGLARSAVLPDHYVVVAMDDPAAATATLTGPLAGSGVRLHTVTVPTGAHLPLAAARNAGARAALAAGARELIFLDVDCIPSRDAIGSYLASIASDAAPALHCGTVRYLDEAHSQATPPVLAGPPHPARPALPAGETRASAEWSLFWSLSFAVDAATWRRLGGFHEGYTVTARRTPTSAWPRTAPGCTCAGWAAPTSTTSTTRRSPRPSGTGTTSCATPPSSTGAGDSGRCRAGSTASPSWGSRASTRGAGSRSVPAQHDPAVPHRARR